MSSIDLIDEQRESRADAAPPPTMIRNRRLERNVGVVMPLFLVSGEIGPLGGLPAGAIATTLIMRPFRRHDTWSLVS